MSELVDRTFWKRLEMFVANVQVNDMMSEEEKEYILLTAKRNIDAQSEFKNLQQAHVIKSLLADLPENRPLYKDSGLWQMRSDDMEEVLIQQGVNETDIEFLARCKASNVL